MVRKYWTQADLMIMESLYANTSTEDMAMLLKCSVRRVYYKAHVMKLHKSPEFLKSPESGCMLKGDQRGKNTRFRKGHVPWTTGMKGVHFNISTEFKKGTKPHNTLYDGAIVTRMSHKKRNYPPYKWIRVANGKWRLLHAYLWEQEYGKPPAGMIVVFKDKNTLHCELDNLELITRKENMQRNTIHRYPAEIKQAIRAVNKLSKTILNYGT